MKDIAILASKVVSSYLSDNVDMNSTIAKIASDHSLNLEQTKRLVEESNKSCYLEKLAKTGDQIFDIADLDKVKKNLQDSVEIKKEASVKLSIDRNTNLPAYGVDLGMEKTASEKDPSLEDFNKAILECKEKIGNNLTKVAELRKHATYLMPALEGLTETELPSALQNTSMEKIGSEIQFALNEADKFGRMHDHLLEKRASLIGSAIKGVAGGTIKAGAAGVNFVAKKPIQRGLTPVMYAGTFKQGAKKAAGTVESHVTNAPQVLEELKKTGEEIEKDAGVISDAAGFLKDHAGLALALGAVGIGTFAAQKLGGTVGQMMDRRNLDHAFDTIQATNEDIRNIPQAREYFNLVARHSPSLAMDPLVAPQLIRQFDTFGGVDINTVGKLREIENTGNRMSSSSGTGDLLGNMSALQGLRSNGLKIKEKELDIQNQRLQSLKSLKFSK